VKRLPETLAVLDRISPEAALQSTQDTVRHVPGNPCEVRLDLSVQENAEGSHPESRSLPGRLQTRADLRDRERFAAIKGFPALFSEVGEATVFHEFQGVTDQVAHHQRKGLAAPFRQGLNGRVERRFEDGVDPGGLRARSHEGVV
jgi:hypothetical protein